MILAVLNYLYFYFFSYFLRTASLATQRMFSLCLSIYLVFCSVPGLPSSSFFKHHVSVSVSVSVSVNQYSNKYINKLHKLESEVPVIKNIRR